MNIPSEFQLFGTTYLVKFDNERLNDKKVYGLCNYSTCEITLSTTENLNPLSHDRIKDTFYHERTHAILDMMNEHELSENEKFVDVFSKLLRQADESAKFEKQIKPADLAEPRNHLIN